MITRGSGGYNCKKTFHCAGGGCAAHIRGVTGAGPRGKITRFNFLTNGSFPCAALYCLLFLYSGLCRLRSRHAARITPRILMIPPPPSRRHRCSAALSSGCGRFSSARMARRAPPLALRLAGSQARRCRVHPAWQLWGRLAARWSAALAAQPRKRRSRTPKAGNISSRRPITPWFL